MNLETALTLHARVYTLYSAPREGTTHIFIERHFHHPLQDEGTILQASFFGLVVLHDEKIVESIVCKDFGELEDAIIMNIHGGRELQRGDYWQTTNPYIVVDLP